LDDIGREFDSSDDEVTDNGGHEAALDDEFNPDEEPNACSTVERLERSEEIHIGTRPSATTATLDGLNGATRWQVNRRFGERSVQCKQSHCFGMLPSNRRAQVQSSSMTWKPRLSAARRR